MNFNMDDFNKHYYLVNTRCSGTGLFKLENGESFQEVFKRLDLYNITEIYKPGTWDDNTWKEMVNRD